MAAARILTAMASEQAIQSGEREVEEREHMAAGLEMPSDPAVEEREPEIGLEAPVLTELGELQLAMFAQGQAVRVRVGNVHNSSELYEAVYETADEANSALLDAGILSKEQIGDPTVPAGTGILLQGVTAEQLEEAGLKKHGTSNLG